MFKDIILVNVQNVPENATTLKSERNILMTKDATDPHKKMLKRSKRLAKKMGKKSFKEKTKNLKGYEAAGAMFSPDAWR